MKNIKIDIRLVLVISQRPPDCAYLFSAPVKAFKTNLAEKELDPKGNHAVTRH